MGRRLLFFGFGALISIFLLSMGPENRLKDTFYAYMDYFDMNQRVITHLENDSTTFTTMAECQLVYYNLSKEDLLNVLDEGEVNFDLSDKDGDPCQYYLIEQIFLIWILNPLQISFGGRQHLLWFEYLYTLHCGTIVQIWCKILLYE